MQNKQFPWFVIIVIILGLLTSTFLIITETNVIYKQDKFTMKIVLEPETDVDGGYLKLSRNTDTPSTLDWAVFDNGETYKLFSISQGEVIQQKVFFDIPDLEKGQYKIDWEAKFLSGKVETGTLTFRVI